MRAAWGTWGKSHCRIARRYKIPAGKVLRITGHTNDGFWVRALMVITQVGRRNRNRNRARPLARVCASCCAAAQERARLPSFFTSITKRRRDMRTGVAIALLAYTGGVGARARSRQILRTAEQRNRSVLRQLDGARRASREILTPFTRNRAEFGPTRGNMRWKE